MGSSSDDDSDISDSEINEYKEKPCELLMDGTYKVKGPKGALRCPFCGGRKKQDYQYYHLYQHAIGVAKGTAKNAKQRANHLALATYLEPDLPNHASEAVLQSVKILHKPAPVANPEQNKLYCWPWVGIVANILDDSTMTTCDYWMKKFVKYKPSDIVIFRDECQAVVRFDHDWARFKNAMEFEKSFEHDGQSKNKWNEQMDSPGSNLYGWFASEDNLFTVLSDVTWGADTAASIITFSLFFSLLSEMRKLQRTAREHIKMVLAEQEILNMELDSKKRRLDSWSKELNKREAVTECERQKLDEEKKKNDVRNNALQLASEEQRKVDAYVLRLVEGQKREKETMTIYELQRNLDENQKLEIEELKGKLEVTKHLGGDDDSAQVMTIQHLDTLGFI